METIERFLEVHPDIRFIRYEWLDYFNIVRTRVLTKAHVLHLTATERDLTVQSAALYCSYVGHPDRAPAAGVCTLHPDWTSLAIYSCYPGHASVICWVHEGMDDMHYQRCPRSTLARCVRDAKLEGDFEFLVGFEIEIVLIDPGLDPSSPVMNVAAWSSAAGLRNRYHGMLEDIVLNLESSGVMVQQYHTEGAQGMFEIVTGPLSPLEAVDALLRTQETIKAICSRNNVTATMFPKPTERPNNVGQHIHFSVAPTDGEDHFLAGVLENLPAICAISMPSYDSYARVKDFSGTVGTWVSWGLQLRDVPIRKIETGHWEYRPADATANMYLVLSAILGSGIWGQKSKRSLTWSDPGIPPSRLDQSKRTSCNMVRQLPNSMKIALGELEQSSVMALVLGKELVHKYLEQKTEEERIESKKTEWERRKLCLEYF